VSCNKLIATSYTTDIVSVSDQRSGVRLDDREHILGGRTIQNDRSHGSR